MRKLVYGVGINDADYPISETINSKQVLCPIYKIWFSMLKRCYAWDRDSTYSSYEGCEVCDEWLYFSKFKHWMDRQDWYGMELDKDIINPGNKVYSPENCAFIDGYVNKFILQGVRGNSKEVAGFYFSKQMGKYYAQCSNPFTKKRVSLGYHDDEISAHNAWKSKKREFANLIADYQTDDRVAKGLRIRYE